MERQQGHPKENIFHYFANLLRFPASVLHLPKNTNPAGFVKMERQTSVRQVQPKRGKIKKGPESERDPPQKIGPLRA